MILLNIFCNHMRFKISLDSTNHARSKALLMSVQNHQQTIVIKLKILSLPARIQPCADIYTSNNYVT